jgi:hypothetical protein
MSILSIDEQWYAIDSGSSLKEKTDMENRINIMELHMREMEINLREMQKTINVMHNENLKLVNRVLEAEIALERAKNSLLRNHIPFPFASSPLHNKFKL